MIFWMWLMRDRKNLVSADTLDDETSEKPVSADTLDDETSELVSRVAERVARDMFPPIAEKIIREEINKLKERFGE